MKNDSHLCIVCNKRPPSNSIYLRCGSCWGSVRKIVVARFSPPPTPQPTPCRVWQGSTDRDGYGLRRNLRLHRWVWQSVHGPIPAGMVIMHKCDNPPCFRIEHLQMGTVAENNADRERKGRSHRELNPHWLRKQGEQHTQAKLNEKQVAEIKTRIANKENQRKIASDYGVSPALITNIKKGKLWGWV